MSEDHLCIVDRFEGNFAVIEFKDETFSIPKELLSPEIKEGDVIELKIIVNKEITDKRKKRIKDLHNKLFT